MHVYVTRSVYLLVFCALLAGCRSGVTGGGFSFLSAAQVTRPSEEPSGLNEARSGQSGRALTSAACSIQYINDTLVPDGNPIGLSGKNFSVHGWLADEISHRTPDQLRLAIASTSGDGVIWEQEIHQLIERGDVQALYGGDRALLDSGFVAYVNAHDLRPGKYALMLRYKRGNDEVVCNNGRTIVVG